MGRAFFDTEPIARAVFEEADDALGFPLSKIIFEGPEDELKRTEHTQPAILTTSVAIARVFAERLAGTGIAPSFAAGHSLGEYTAHVMAGTFSFRDAVRVVRSRGRYMQSAVPEGEGAMAAILGLSAEQINDLCNQATDELTAQTAATIQKPSENTSAATAEAHSDAPLADSASSQSMLADPTNTPASIARAATTIGALVSPANLNTPEQTVISGSRIAVERAVELCKVAGAKRTIMLPVSAPFHCALMRPAQECLSTDLESMPFSDPSIPIAANVDARFVARSSDARDCLIRQVTGSVRWVECIELLINQGATHFVEIGPGRVLSGLMRQIDRNQKTLNVEDPASMEKTLDDLRTAAAI